MKHGDQVQATFYGEIVEGVVEGVVRDDSSIIFIRDNNNRRRWFFRESLTVIGENLNARHRNQQTDQ